MSTESKTNAAELLAAGKAIAANIINSGGHSTNPAVIVPEGHRVEYLDPLQPAPLKDFIEANVTLYDADSFIAYVKEYRTATTLIFAAPVDKSGTSAGLTAHLEYHDGKAPRPRRNSHTARYPLPLSVELLAWLSINERAQGQVAFARFLDDHVQDVIRPESALLIELGESLNMKREVEFQSTIKRSTGGRTLIHKENVEAKISAGTVQVPQVLTLLLPVFEGGDSVEIDARIDLDVREGKPFITIQLVRLHVILREALAKVCQRVADETAIDVLSGKLE